MLVVYHQGTRKGSANPLRFLDFGGIAANSSAAVAADDILARLRALPTRRVVNMRGTDPPDSGPWLAEFQLPEFDPIMDQPMVLDPAQLAQWLSSPDAVLPPASDSLQLTSSGNSSGTNTSAKSLPEEDKVERARALNRAKQARFRARQKVGCPADVGLTYGQLLVLPVLQFFSCLLQHPCSPSAELCTAASMACRSASSRWLRRLRPHVTTWSASSS